MKKIITFSFAFILLLTSCYTKNEDGHYDYYYENAELVGDNYVEQVENPFVNVTEQPISTFSIDADGASYANVRRFVMQDQQLPPLGAIRTEELINYFDLDYDFEATNHPISLNGEVSICPWNAENKLVRIGLKGKDIPQLPASNFVFLIDVSGSMDSEDKLELLKNGFKLFVDELSAADKVAIVTYAGGASVVLEATAGDEKQKIKNAIDQLGAGGGTAGAEGIVTAYEIAEANFVENGNNRIVVGTDGDFNIGISSQEDLITLIEEKRDIGVFLTVLGVGRGNLNDAALEQIANNGNGTYEYIDNIEQLRKVFLYEYDKFFTVAKDVKVQVAFNPENVSAYRLIGYENRLLEAEAFEDDSEDAGELGANQNVTALYEIVPMDNPDFRDVPTFTIDFRYKEPNADVSVPLELMIFDEGYAFEEASDFMKWTASVAAFSMLLLDSEYKGSCTYEQLNGWLNSANLADEHGLKAEFKNIVNAASTL
ncbi:MAG: vWA domain-containing protein [Chitinophagales bacterium]